MNSQGFPPPDAVGHRVVHGGATYTAPALIDEKLIAALKDLIVFAPLHQPSEILCIESVSKQYPGLPQVACFDTAFHATIPKVAYMYALPYELYEKYGIRRYGSAASTGTAPGPRPPGRRRTRY
jgi:acetate kinase